MRSIYIDSAVVNAVVNHRCSFTSQGSMSESRRQITLAMDGYGEQEMRLSTGEVFCSPYRYRSIQHEGLRSISMRLQLFSAEESENADPSVIFYSSKPYVEGTAVPSMIEGEIHLPVRDHEIILRNILDRISPSRVRIELPDLAIMTVEGDVIEWDTINYGSGCMIGAVEFIYRWR